MNTDNNMTLEQFMRCEPPSSAWYGQPLPFDLATAMSPEFAAGLQLPPWAVCVYDYNGDGVSDFSVFVGDDLKLLVRVESEGPQMPRHLSMRMCERRKFTQQAIASVAEARAQLAVWGRKVRMLVVPRAG